MSEELLLDPELFVPESLMIDREAGTAETVDGDSRL